MFNNNFGGANLTTQRNKNELFPEPTPKQREQLLELLVDEPKYYVPELPLILPDTTEDRAPFARAVRVFRSSEFATDHDEYDKRELLVKLANGIVSTIREKKLNPKVIDAITGTYGVDGYTQIPVINNARNVGTDADNLSGFIEGVYVGDHRLYHLNERGQRVYQRGNRVMSPRAISRQNTRILNDLRGGSSLNGLLDDYIREQSVAESSSDFFDRMGGTP